MSKTFVITVLGVTIETKPTKNGGTYQMANVAYKETDGKIQGQKILDFSNKDLFQIVAAMQSGETYQITKEKVGEYWNWVKVERAEAPTPAPAQPAKPSQTTPQAYGRSGNYETPEERQARQRFIVRQSSLTAALATLTPGAKAPLDPSLVEALAERYTDFVFEQKRGVEGMAAMTDDIPE